MDERAAPVCSQIRQKHWNCIYRSSVSIRYENPTALGSGSRAAAHGNNFGRDEGVRQQGIKGIEIEREREERWFCSLLFTASIVRNRPLPRKSRNLVMKETVPSSPLLTRIKSFTDA